MPPYLPSLEWLVQNGVVISNPPMDSDGFVSARPVMKTREYTRTLIESNSPEGMVLTVPVVGGSSAVKRLNPEQLEISSHGEWTKIHLGAIEAAYGREPYFQHFFPGIAGIIANYPPKLGDMNIRLLLKIFESINLRENFNDIKDMRMSHPERFENIRRRFKSKINPSHSIIEPLFRLGPDTVFIL